MKPSGIEWIGDIPDDWKVLKYKYAGRFEKGKLPKFINRENKGSPIIGASEMNGGLPILFTEDSDIPKCRKDDVLFLWDGANAGLVSSGLDGILSSTVVKYVCTNSINIKYLFYLTKYYEKYFKSKVNGTTIPHMSYDFISDCPLLEPPLRTQQRIADYLDEKCGEIDATISKQKESIEKLKAYKQSLISETVTKGLDKSAPLKPSGIDYLGDIPSHWEIKKLKFVANFNQNTLPEDTDGQFELKYIDIGNVSSVDGIKEIQYFNFSNAPSRARRIVKYGDIIVSTVRTYLRAITSIKEDYDNCICSTGFAVITPKDNVQQDFVVYAIENESFIAQIIANSQGISYPAINVSQLENLKLAFPSVKEQKEIIDFLKTKLLEIDLTINKKQNIIQKLDAYKKSLIFECVTGKCSILG